jgi:hypothetical protein
VTPAPELGPPRLHAIWRTLLTCCLVPVLPRATRMSQPRSLRPPLQTLVSNSWSTRPRGPRHSHHRVRLKPLDLLVSLESPASSYDAENGRRPDLAVRPLTSSCAPTPFQEMNSVIVHTFEFPVSRRTPLSTPLSPRTSRTSPASTPYDAPRRKPSPHGEPSLYLSHLLDSDLTPWNRSLNEGVRNNPSRSDLF